MSRILVILLVVLAFTLVTAYVLDWTRRRRTRWAEAARRLGGVFDPAAGPWYRRTPQIEVRLGGVDVVIETDSDNDTLTRARCDVLHVGDFTLQLSSKGLLARTAVALGAQDVATGDGAFDDAFVVRTNDPERARAFLNAEVRARLLTLGKLQLEVREGELTAKLPEGQPNAEAIEDLARASAALAARGPALHALWEEVARSEGGAVEEVAAGRLRIQIDASVPLRLERIDGDACPTTVVVARRLDATPEPFVLASDGDLDSTQPDRARRRIEPLAARIQSLGARVEANDEELLVLVDDLEGDPERIRETMALARDLAAPLPNDPYR